MGNSNFDLTQEAVLVRVPIRMAGMTAKSRMLSKEAASNHGGDFRSFTAGVQKLEKEALGDITAIMNAARAAVDNYTLPWDDQAYRLCPLPNYPKLLHEVRELQNKLSDAVQDLAGNYNALHKDYLRRVNDVADEVPFPTYNELLTNFAIEWRELPLANPSDIRLKHVNAKTVDEIRESMQKVMDEKLAEGRTEIVSRVKKVVSHLKDRCETEEGRIFKSTVGNIEALVEVLPALNIDNDPSIARLIKKMKEDLTGIDVEDLKRDPKFKAATAKAATSVLADIKKSFGQ